ncbi:MAG: EscU/YscU/HrcU family type III secretion system export apparatus switch protein [Proteobacteria bacterium]|nr:EscU/YscU/HrcU family type III secretion system export apparatus switch protein [Pseudomonadota bacterium]MBU1709415.1 EscU/YscU/HrcU family type III secretion system export apparatus switch protein [Pseudomonadota bacterium]
MPKKTDSGKAASRKKAIAIRYDKGRDPAPKIVGKGEGLVAERILALARELGIPIHEDTDLTEILARLDLNEEIPPSTYLVVAEILAFIYRANKNWQP